MNREEMAKWVARVGEFIQKTEFRETVDSALLDRWRKDGAIGKPPRTFFATRLVPEDFHQDVCVAILYMVVDTNGEEKWRVDGAVTFYPLTVVRFTPEQAEVVREKVEKEKS